ncbi:hypothetical protein KW415_06615 [Vibrio fluvialis]|nr:hypothetical protein [Vibrio fluvialis]
MKHKQYNSEEFTITITVSKQVCHDDEFIDLNDVKSEKIYPISDANNGGEPKKWYKTYLSPFVLYQAFLGACISLGLTYLFLS